MKMKWAKYPAVATAGMFIAFSGAIAQQGAAGAGAQGGAAGAGAQGSAAGAGAQSGSSAGAAGATGAQGSGGAGSSMSSNSGSGSAKSGADSKFVMEAAQGGMAEVELGRVAVQKAQNDKVKQFGQRMIDDHTKANDELKSVASGKGMTLSADLDAKHKSAMDKMSGMSGAAFDKAYAANMVKDHQKDVALFQKESTNGSDPELKAFAAKTLPTLQEHLRLAQEMQADVKAGGSSKGSSMTTSSGSGASGNASGSGAGASGSGSGNSAAGGNSSTDKK